MGRLAAGKIQTGFLDFARCIVEPAANAIPPGKSRSGMRASLKHKTDMLGIAVKQQGELAMMSARQVAFRAAYRAQIAPAYHGLIHVALIYLIGGSALWYASQQIQSPKLAEWAVVPCVVVLANVFEWFLHAQVMHRPRRGLMGIYNRHTLAHHQFFTQEAPYHESTRDFRIVFFPPYALIAFLVMASGIGAVLAELWSANAGWFVVCTAAGMYMNYEFFHWCCHVQDDRMLRYLPFINTIRRHHIAHHNTAIMMNRNMNLTYPVADWLFGTSDLNRGLLGHLFNGYDTRFIRQDLPRVRSAAGRAVTAAAE